MESISFLSFSRPTNGNYISSKKGKNLSQKAAKPMWLAWIGEEQLSLIELWKLYLRRFSIEHWNRFVKQRLHWRATPRRRKTQGNARAGQRLNWEP